jgi:threonine dehydratase
VGAFKVRGAANALAALPSEVRARGVVTHSSGNHAQALAYAARTFGVPVTVVMPDVAPPLKIDATRALGAEVILVPPAERESRTAVLVAERGLTLVPPYDHPDVIAGQGTVGLEIVEDLPGVATVLVPVGGGGLASGVATAVKALAPGAAVIGVEPALAADAADSLAAGELRTWTTEERYRTVADGLRTTLSALTFAHLRERLDRIVTVSEDEILATVPELARRARIVAEPSGAVAPAAYLYHRDGLPPGPTVAVVSGGNIDPALLARLLSVAG